MYCKSCRFFDKDGTKYWGSCKRYAPHPLSSDFSPDINWPIVALEDWCGEFESTDEKEKECKDENWN